jgi:hypothetical protein
VGEKPTIVFNPLSDKGFEEAIAAAINGGAVDPRDLQQSLRRSYPATVVRPRELAGERGVVWYVYRDGRWVSGR